MAVQQLPNGRWRATVTDAGKRVSAAKVLGLAEPSFATKRAAQRAQNDAEDKIKERAGLAGTNKTVSQFRDEWLTDSMFAHGKKESTLIGYRRQTARFADLFGHMLMCDVSSDTVRAWLRAGNHAWTVPALRAMFNDATADHVALVVRNPFANLKLKRGKGNAEVEPPSEDEWWALNAVVAQITPPGFAAWFQFASWTALRPGEVDALTWDDLLLDARRVRVRRQFNDLTQTMGKPKNGNARTVLMFQPAWDAVIQLPHESEFVFTNLRGDHWSKQSRNGWWRKVRKASGYSDTLYMATRHFCAHHLYETLRQPAEDVAIQLGHTDDGDLVRKLYGHHNAEAALDRIAAAALAAHRPRLTVVA